ncbi:MAG: FKBP-type peptidyl-prolyl cis-trans isomerase [Chitinophagaceae bacterium]
MKKALMILSLGFVTFTAAYAQKKTTPVKKLPMPAKSAPVKMSSIDSFSYAVGLQSAKYYKSQGVSEINSAMLKKAAEDVFQNKTLVMTEEQCNSTIQHKLQSFMANKNKAEKDRGTAFLAANKKKQGIIELPNGMQYEILKAGNGEKPSAQDTVKAHYAGTLIDGTEFDNSYKRGEPLQIPVGGVIQGWVQALQMMPVGSKWKLYIPSDLAYGDRGAGNGAIPGGATLIFEIELLELLKAKKQ